MLFYIGIYVEHLASLIVFLNLLDEEPKNESLANA